MELSTQVQILEEVVFHFISLGNGMNTFVIPRTTDQY